MDEEDGAPSPADVIPGYETDLSAVGTNRRVDPAAVDDRPWYEFFEPEVYWTVELPDDVQVRT